jgi:hypothetical protein
MKTIIFSALFGMDHRSERLRFLTDVCRAFPEPVRFVAFNTSGVVKAEFDVVNATARLKSSIDNPVAYLESWLTGHFPDKVKLFMDHVVGEFGKRRKSFDGSISKIILMLQEFEGALASYQPDYVYLWNQFNAFHRILAELLKKRGIPFGFFHDGVLPGSIALDVDGEMGESWIARDPKRFMKIKVSAEDVARATEFLAGLQGDQVNRHPQVEQISVKQALVHRKLHKRPVVFFAGQNDWHAGIKPRSPDRAFHSHLFAGSAEAVQELDRIASTLGVTILFKPHPLSKDRYMFLRSEELSNTLILSSTSMQACLKASDVVSTIASQTSYVALLEDRPVMMLGKNQVNGKGLTYDVDSLDDIAGMIELSISDPLKQGRKAAFARHVAQLERSYLFSYTSIGEDYYRRGPKAAARYMSLSMSMPTKDVIDMQASGQII